MQPLPGFPTRSSTWAFGASESAKDLVIVESLFDDPITRHVSVASWLSVEANGMTLLARAQIDIPEAVHHVVVAGDDAFALGWKGVAHLRRTGSSIDVVGTRTWSDAPTDQNPVLARILGFDGKRAAVAIHRWIRPGPVHSQWTVEVLDAADLSSLARYDTSEEVHTLSVSGTHLVFGMNGAVAVADPECR